MKHLAVGQDSSFREFMERIDSDLEHEQQQKNPGDLKEASDIN
jgi:hypothetical protein